MTVIRSPSCPNGNDEAPVSFCRGTDGLVVSRVSVEAYRRKIALSRSTVDPTASPRDGLAPPPTVPGHPVASVPAERISLMSP